MSQPGSRTPIVGMLLRNQYDVAFSLNGRDLGKIETAEPIARHLRRHGLKVFFYRDPEELQRSLGTDLQTRLPSIYAENSRLVVLVASPTYGLEGLTQLEWRVIRQRLEQSPDEQFLIPISTVEADHLPEGVRDRVFLCSGSMEGKHWPQPVVAAVIRRLGRWPLIKSTVYHTLLVAAVLSLLYHWSIRTYVDPAARIISVLAIASAVVWWLAFRVVPRLRPSVVYAPRSILSRLHQQLYLSLVAERLLFAAVLFSALLAHAVLPSIDSQMQSAMADWLAGEPAKRTAGLHFFEQRIPQEMAVNLWTAVLVNEARYSGADRGKALDMISRLLSTGKGQQPPQKDIATRIRIDAEKGLFGLNRDNWPSSLSAIDASGVDLDHTVFARMQFAGNETNFAGAALKQSDFSATYWQATNFDKADLRWSSFPLAAFIGIRGQVTSGGAHFPECTFFDCNLNESSFFAADLTGVKFLSCSLAGADFTNAHLTGTTFEDCDLTNAKFTVDEVRWGDRWGILAGVSFIRCRMAGVTIAGADFRGQVLSVYRGRTADPSNLNAFTQVYTRDDELAGVDRERQASVPILPTMFADCRFRDDESKVTDAVPTGADFAKVQSTGLLMDRATYDRLSTVEQMQLKDGGFDLTELRDKTPDKDLQRWDNLKSDVLKPLFEAAGN